MVISYPNISWTLYHIIYIRYLFHNICTSADSYVAGIINRAGTGPCPFEAAVMHIQDAQSALIAIREKRRQMQKET